MANILDEVLSKLISLEMKLNNTALEITKEPAKGFRGHPDQWYGSSTYAQHGDDLVILNIFNKLGIAYPSYMDIGAHHPYNISNTALLYSRGCRGINIEANPNLYHNFVQLRPDDINLNIGIGVSADTLPFYMIDDWSGRNTFSKQIAEEFVAAHPNFTVQKVMSIEVQTIQQVIDLHFQGKFPDLLTIDIEGLDYSILNSQNFSLTYPKLICVEISSGNDTDVSQDMRTMLRKKGFIEVFQAASNSFLIHESLHDAYAR
jgi:FkbM family methyltransferase